MLRCDRNINIVGSARLITRSDKDGMMAHGIDWEVVYRDGGHTYLV